MKILSFWYKQWNPIVVLSINTAVTVLHSNILGTKSTFQWTVPVWSYRVMPSSIWYSKGSSLLGWWNDLEFCWFYDRSRWVTFLCDNLGNQFYIWHKIISLMALRVKYNSCSITYFTKISVLKDLLNMAKF